MPRDGANIYHRPPGTDAVPDTTIESSKYNAYVADVEQDLNTPRPIVAGGTGAANAHDAMVALSGEIAGQHVDNYDMFPFVAGSFWSSGATAGPAGSGYYSGECHVFDSGNMVLEAREYVAGVTGRRFTRQKQGGVWLAWQQAAGSVADLDAAYVNVAGDTMTGALTIAPAAGPAVLNLNPLAGQQGTVSFLSANATKWQLGKQTDDSIFLYDVVGGSYILNAASGAPSLTLGKNTAVNGTVTAGIGGTTGTYYFGNSGTKSLSYDGASFVMSGAAQLVVTGDIFAYRTAAVGTGLIAFGNSGAKTLYYDGTNYILTGGALICYGTVNATAPGAPTTGVMSFGAGGMGSIYWDASKFNVIGGNFVVNGDITAARNATQGVTFFGTGGSNYIYYDGTQYNFLGSGASGILNAGRMVSSAAIQSGTGFVCRAGTSGGTGNLFNMFYSGPVALWIDASNLGNIAFTSDYRIKKDVIDLPSMWDTVKGLRPIKYTQADFTPPAQKEANAKRRSDHAAAVREAETKGEEPPPAPDMPAEPMFKADNIERWGFIAHELQDTLIPTASTGVKDSPDHVQSPNPFTVIAALTRALQEAMGRIEQLEARVAQPK